MRRMDAADRYYVEVPGYDYWKRQIKCQYACPVHTDARGYIRAIAEGDYERAYLIARGPNPLASICGRVCGAPCEVACRRGSVDDPVAIRALKGFATEKFGPEAGQSNSKGFLDYLKRRWPRRDCESSEELDSLFGLIQKAARQVRERNKDGERVAIIGGGPGGLACAHDLALMGIRSVIFEMEPAPAGLLYTGVPEYRLPREVIRSEVAVIEAMGVEIRCGVEIGKDISFEALRKEFAAVVIAVGAKHSRRLQIPGADGAGVIGGVEFLRDVALGRPNPLGQRVVVIGGGNVAFDVGRTVIRQTEFDVSRTAARQPSVREVHLCCLESRDEMPADDIEIKEAAQEGVARHNRVGPVEIYRDSSGNVSSVIFERVVSVFDEDGRFSPKFDSSDTFELPADTVLVAIGQAADLNFIDPDRDGIDLTERKQIKHDELTNETTAPGVFLAGDIQTGPKLMIDAIASGKQTARGIYQYLRGSYPGPSAIEFHVPVADYAREKGYEKIRRINPPIVDASKRVQSWSTPVEIGYGDAIAVCEASRCLDCGVNTIFDSDKCIMCGGCVDVCPESCLKLVPIGELVAVTGQDHLLDDLMGVRYGNKIDFEENTAMIKDETLCIRCGLCAERCPTNTITMERFRYQEGWQ
ncbi:MAG: FAD-dependent oxidoreductase [Armatimonadetes bacterium]|nr:FAD-dependent oxidoreductase [Armatimonadota bacterium]